MNLKKDKVKIFCKKVKNCRFFFQIPPIFDKKLQKTNNSGIFLAVPLNFVFLGSLVASLPQMWYNTFTLGGGRKLGQEKEV